jgi:hypothetical protein
MPFVKRNKPNVLQVNSPKLGGSAITIKPGVNSLTHDQLERCKATRGFMACVKSGAIEILDTDDKTPAKGAPKAPAKKPKSGVEQIRGMKVVDAVKIIAEILNVEDLEAIKASDKRQGIQAAVEEQLDKLTLDDDNEE